MERREFASAPFGIARGSYATIHAAPPHATLTSPVARIRPRQWVQIAIARCSRRDPGYREAANDPAGRRSCIFNPDAEQCPSGRTLPADGC